MNRPGPEANHASYAGQILCRDDAAQRSQYSLQNDRSVLYTARWLTSWAAITLLYATLLAPLVLGWVRGVYEAPIAKVSLHSDRNYHHWGYRHVPLQLPPGLAQKQRRPQLEAKSTS